MSTTNLDNGEVDVSARGLRTSLWCRLIGGGTIDITRAPGVAPLVGRDREQRALADVLAVGARRPAGVLLRGEAGIGKSSLWRSGLAMAREQRRGTLVARPAAEEKDIALSGLVDLLDGHALASVGHPVLHGPDTPLGRGRALLEEIRRRAADGPLVVAVDDTPWLDDASAQAMRYALRRLETEPVTVLATARSSDGDVDRLELSTTLSAHPVKVIEVSPLGVDDLRDVLATHVDRLSRPMLRRIHAISAGNPFYAIELARCVQVGRGGQRVIVLPTSVREALDHRLAALDPDLRAVVAVLAVAGPQPREVLGEILGSDVGQVVDRGCTTGVLLVDEHARVRFAHPLLAAAADVRMGAADRRALHSRVALVIPDPEDGLRHRTLGTPDPDDAIAATAEATAQQARRRGAGDTAIALSEQAVRLTPPADVDAHTRRRLQLVDHLAAAGEVGRARAQVDDLVADLPRGHWGAEALVRRFYVDRDDYPTGAAGLAQALPQIDDHAIRARVLDMLGWVRGMFCGDLEAGLACAREAAGLFESGTDVAAGLLAAAHLAHMETAAGLGPAGAMAGVVARTEAHGAPLLGACPRAWLAKQLLWDGDVDASRRLVLRLLSEGARTGNELERPYRLYDLALVELTAGRLPEAGWALRAGTMAAADAGNRDAAGWLAYPRALWHALVGRADEARASAAELLDAAGRPGGLPAQARAHRVLGALALAHGDLATAAEELGTAVELLQRWGIRHPGVVPALPDAVEAYAGTGDLAGARGLMAQLEDQVERTGSAWASVVLRRSRAVVMLADGDANSAADELLEVATALAGLGHRLEAGRALLLAGQALLRAGRRTAAADTLCTAHDDFGRYGAVLWQARARTEAERAAAGRATGCLTPTERRVVQLVVDGRRNREIAAEMYLGVATVEAHLTRTYRKLGIRSRSELVGLVGRGDLDLDRGFSR